MKSITIHNIDDEMATRLARRARETGVSLNKLIKEFLAITLGLSKSAPDHRGDFKGFCGVWSAKESAAFKSALRDFERADPKDWE